MALLFLAACAASGGAREAEIFPTDDTRADNVNADWVWSKRELDVCFLHDDAALEEAALVRTAIEATWAAHSQLTFRGWGACDASPERTDVAIDLVPFRLLGNAHIELEPNRDGSRRDLISIGIWRNVCVVMPNGVGYEFTDANSRALLQSTAIHEVGHSLGFRHEDARPDAPPACRGLSTSYETGPRGRPPQERPYDPHSVMNLCAPDYATHGVWLSAGDIAAVRALYGEPTNEPRAFDDAQLQRDPTCQL